MKSDEVNCANPRTPNGRGTAAVQADGGIASRD
jgi:hypothetical protein